MKEFKCPYCDTYLAFNFHDFKYRCPVCEHTFIVRAGELIDLSKTETHTIKIEPVETISKARELLNEFEERLEVEERKYSFTSREAIIIETIKATLDLLDTMMSR